MTITVTPQEITIETGDNTPPQRYAVLNWLDHPPVVDWSIWDEGAWQRKAPELTITAEVVPMRDVTGEDGR